jgi:hypothetical protein
MFNSPFPYNLVLSSGITAKAFACGWYFGIFGPQQLPHIGAFGAANFGADIFGAFIFGGSCCGPKMPKYQPQANAFAVIPLDNTKL